MQIPEHCALCPRACGANRRQAVGLCGGGATVRVARAAPHFWEEPCISGSRGSGTVFFTGCSLGCLFCQNAGISRGHIGAEVTIERLGEIFLEMQNKKVHNLNLVTAGHYYPWVLQALEEATARGFALPVVWNSSGYENLETVRQLAPKVDVWLPDLKFHSPVLAEQVAGAPGYFQVASRSIAEMCRLAGPPRFAPDGLLCRGVIIRVLVLPGQHRDAMELLRWMAESLPPHGFLLSLMCQYTPPDDLGETAPLSLRRRVASYEYRQVVEEAVRLGLTLGYTQQRESASSAYTPAFDLSGI